MIYFHNALAPPGAREISIPLNSNFTLKELEQIHNNEKDYQTKRKRDSRIPLAEQKGPST